MELIILVRTIASRNDSLKLKFDRVFHFGSFPDEESNEGSHARAWQIAALVSTETAEQVDKSYPELY